jgi:hypothetical protein
MNHIISNWNELTEDQQAAVLKKMEESPSFEKINEPNPAAAFFQASGWVKLENFISKEMASLLYHHVKLSTARLAYIEEQFPEKYNHEYYGMFGDGQTPGDFCRYGDPIFDALVDESLVKVQEIAEVPLMSNYSYYRLYTTASELKRHKDRPSCEYSVTICLGYDVSNVDQNTYPNYDWPMFVDSNGVELPIHMKPGDAIIYKGCDIDHWRQPFWGLHHAQVFLHYNELNGQYNIRNDGRAIMGLSESFKPIDALESNYTPGKQ